MLIDGRSLDKQEFKADLCIIGAGAAGIALASEFFDSSKKIIVIESGGKEYSEKTQQLYSGKSMRSPYDVTHSRLRFLGGSTNHWEGMCCPLDASDFEKKEWLEESGWPITYEQIAPYYARAAHFLNLSGTSNSDFSSPQNLLPHQHRFKYGAWRYAHAMMPDSALPQGIHTKKNIQVILNSNLFDVTNNNTTIRSVTLKTLEGQSFIVKAEHYVLACGGIENARLLLALNALKYLSDVTGKYFMEHPRFEAGQLFTYAKPNELKPFEQDLDIKNQPEIIYNIAPDTELMKKFSLLNCCSVVRDIRTVKNTPLIAAYMARFFRKNPDLMWQSTLFMRMEHAPSRDNFVSLGDQKDALGMPLTKLSFSLGEKEWESARQFTLLLAEYFGYHSMGVVNIAPWLREYKGWPKHTLWSQHHMGTTRMGYTRSDSVVNADCKIHGLDNFYIAGSSLFPTSGWANPTYTIVALSIRLADHLKKIFAA